MTLAPGRAGGDALGSEGRLVVAEGHRPWPPSSSRPDSTSPAAGRPASAIHGFLFADLRGFTRYTDEHGDAAGAELLERYRVVVRAAARASDGAEIRTEGDSFYLVFGTASAAVRCGLGIVEAAAATPGEQGPIQVGVGIHAGEAVETRDGLVGSAVNIAERLCELAGPGEVIASETVRSLARGALDVAFEPAGSRALKGVGEPVATFRVHTTVPMMRAPGAGRGRVGRDRLRSVAIGAAALLAVGAVGAAILPAALPPASPVPTSSPAIESPTPPTTSASPPTDEWGWTAAESTLLQRVPLEFQEYCRPSDVEHGTAGGIASLRCDLRDAPGYGADTVWYDAFDASTRGRMAMVIIEAAAAADLPTVEGGRDEVMATCARQSGGAVGRWDLGSSLSGQLACYMRDGEAWLAWTYEGQDILARAVRHDGDGARLVKWWDERAADYLR
jgi:class 3 adenylate cyclase